MLRFLCAHAEKLAANLHSRERFTEVDERESFRLVVPKVGTCRQFPNLAVADGESGAWHNRNKHSMDSMGRKMRGISLVRMFGVGVDTDAHTCLQHCSTASMSDSTYAFTGTSRGIY